MTLNPFPAIGRGIGAVRRLFPFSHEGRQTLIYLVLAGAGPALTMAVMWAMRRALEHGWQGVFNGLAEKVAWALLIIVSALACFVSIRAIRLGKDGFGVEGRESDEHNDTTAKLS
jgi:ABC-type multidrug transport system fused ATPase/permease subunit